MIRGRRVLAIVPARSGSKRIPQKNYRICAGKPLAEWTLKEAENSRYIDRIVFASDNLSGGTENQAVISLEKGIRRLAFYIRSEETATDDATSLDLVIEVLEKFPGYDIIVLLQPTSPTRTVDDIDNCIKYLDRNSLTMVASCNANEQIANGSVYVNARETIFPRSEYETDTCKYLEVPFTTDIDNWTDFDDAETVLEMRNKPREKSLGELQREALQGG